MLVIDGRTVAALVGVALLGAWIWSGATAAQAADPPPSAICKNDFPAVSAQKQAEGIQIWMNEQMAAGRTRFMFTSISYPIICAW